MAYTKQNLKNGQKLTAEHINHIEEGVGKTVFFEAQTLTEEQQAQARTNIGSPDKKSVDALNNVVMVSKSPKAAMYKCKNLLDNLVGVVAENDCELTFKGKNLFYGNRTYSQVGITKSAYGNVIRFTGAPTTAISSVSADINCFIPPGKVYVVVDCATSELGEMSFRNSGLTVNKWISDTTIVGQVYSVEITKPAYYFRIKVPCTVEAGENVDGKYDVTVFIGYEPLADGETIPSAQQEKVNATANVSVYENVFPDGYIYTEDGTEFSVYTSDVPERNLYEINNEINDLKARMPIFMSVSDFNKSADAVNNESVIILLS